MAPYVHALEGRLRIKLVDVKGHAARARDVEERVRGLPGVALATANPVTGNVLVLYDVQRTEMVTLLEALRAWGYLRESVASSPAVLPGFGSTLLRAAAEIMLQKLITVLLAA